MRLFTEDGMELDRKKFDNALAIEKRLNDEIKSTENLIREGETSGFPLEGYLDNLYGIQGTLQTKRRKSST